MLESFTSMEELTVSAKMSGTTTLSRGLNEIEANIRSGTYHQAYL